MGFYDPNRRTPDWAGGISEGVGNFMQMQQMKKLMAILAQQQGGGQGQPGNAYQDPGASTLPPMPQNMNTSSMPQGMGQPQMPQSPMLQLGGQANALAGAMPQMGGGSVGGAPGMGGLPAGLTPDLIKKILMAIMMKQGGGGMPSGMPRV